MEQEYPQFELVRVIPFWRDKHYELAKPLITIGLSTLNDIGVHGTGVESTHARLERSLNGFTLVDLSASGTLVNGVQVERAELAPGDVITIGEAALRFEAGHAPDQQITQINTTADYQASEESTLRVRLRDSQPKLVVHRGGHTHDVPLTGEVVRLGSDPGNDIVIDHPEVSPSHAYIERRGDDFVLLPANGSGRGPAGHSQGLRLHEGRSVSIGDAELILKREAGQASLKSAGAELQEAVGRSGGRELPPVVFVPGMMGSQLWDGADLIWPDLRDLLTRPEVLDYRSARQLEARGIVDEVVIIPNLLKQEAYSRMGDYLEEGLGYERGKNLLEFAYDWRQDVRLSARSLARAIDEWGKTPVIIVAHSLGCLVSRYYVEHLGGKEKVGRLVLVGGPHAGVPKALASLVLGPELLPFGLLGDRLRSVTATFPSAYQILPVYNCVSDHEGCDIDILSTEDWLPEASRPLLRAGQAFRRELGNSTSVPTVSIFGYGLTTVTRLIVRRGAKGWDKVELKEEAGGDATIPEGSALLQGSEIHPVQQYHGALYVDPDVKMRLKYELMRSVPS